jgi:glycosyltransferase involved in cell wall biosynthesis
MKTILVLPAYNEARYISTLVQDAQKYVDEVIVVNDNSSDDTAALAKKAGATVLTHRVNLRKAAALKTGAYAAIRMKADIIVFMDSDGQHLAKDLPRFIDPIKQEHYQVVIGGRKGGDKMPLFRKMGNLSLEWASRILFGIKIRDIQSGFRAFRADVFDQLEWKSKGYHADAEMTVRTGKYRLKYKQIDITTIYHDDFKGMTVVDGLDLLLQIFLWRITL